MSKLHVLFTGKLLNYADYTKYSRIFIETGSAAGDGIQRALDAGFKPVASCEGADKWFWECEQRFFDNKAVNIYRGKSTEVLGAMLPHPPVQCVIFLDAHPAGPLSFGHQDWLDNPNGEANQHNIIQAELSIILAHRKDHVIIIDDVNGMADGCASVYMDMCLQANPDYTFQFFDENLSGNLLYTNKILVCLPK